jgi:MFS family permease
LVVLNIINLAVTGLLQIGDVETLYIFRLLQGVLVGNFMTLVPTYIGELTPKELGSRFGVYPQVSVVLGVLVAFLMGVIYTNCFNIVATTIPSQLQQWQWEICWRVQLGIPLLPSLVQLFFIAINYIPESPHSLIIKNRKDTAREVLSLFYEESYVDQLVEERESAIFNKKSELEESKVTWSTKGYVIGMTLAIFQVLTGIASFVTQAGHVIAFTFNQNSIGLYTPILITISQLVGTFVSIPMLKYFEWRKMTIIGGFVLAFFDAMIGMLLYLYEQYPGNTDAQNYILLMTCICIMFFMFTFGMTLGSSVWPYINFMMPASAVTAALIINWVLAGLSIIAFSFVTNAMKSPYVMLFIYCGVTFVLSIVFSCISINIKGLSVRKVQMQLQ